MLILGDQKAEGPERGEAVADEKTSSVRLQSLQREAMVKRIADAKRTGPQHGVRVRRHF